MRVLLFVVVENLLTKIEIEMAEGIIYVVTFDVHTIKG